MINIKDVRDCKSEDVVSLGKLQEMVEHAVKTCEMNNRDIYKIPVVITNNTKHKDYLMDGTSFHFGGDCYLSLTCWESNEIDYYECVDKRPENGEYWASRGASYDDVSGYVVSKEAGERLLRLVKYVLNKDDIETFLDWREYEPNYIQFKFSAKEFDIERLSDMAINNGNVITEAIIRECVKTGKTEQDD